MALGRLETGEQLCGVDELAHRQYSHAFDTEFAVAAAAD